jgi:hypothetical protein
MFKTFFYEWICLNFKLRIKIWIVSKNQISLCTYVFNLLLLFVDSASRYAKKKLYL